MTIYDYDRIIIMDHTCANTDCPCAKDGKHSGKPTFSAMYGGEFCCRRSYVRMHYNRNRETYVARATAWNKSNPDRRRIIAKEHYLKTVDGKRDYWLQRTYGITLAQYDEMVATQCGVCAVCGEPETTKDRDGETKRLAVHHSHNSDVVIALLCHACNRGIGFLRDSAKLLQNAANLQLQAGDL
jgi:hypothetical protein